MALLNTYNLLLVVCLTVYPWEICGVGAKKNVLLIIVDDLRPELTAFHGPEWPELYAGIHTPNLDSLAGRSAVFRKAYVQQAVCVPSRASFLTGRRPDTTHVWTLEDDFREKGGRNWTTLPQYFSQHGYEAVGMGKVTHIHDDLSWTRPFYVPPGKFAWNKKYKSWKAVTKEQYTRKPLPDQQSAQLAMDTLKEFQSSGQDFFLALGFMKPHLPFIFPERFLDLYPLANISQPANPYTTINLPELAWYNWIELRKFKDISKLKVKGKINQTLDELTTLQLRRAYYASVSYIDELVGQVLDTLYTTGLANDTIVAFLSDHGWQLGEHASWCKNTNYELATHAPLMIHVPGLTDQGQVISELVEFVDLYPTLAELSGLPQVDLCPQVSGEVSVCREGSSLVPLMTSSSNFQWKDRVFSQYQRHKAKFMGYSMRTARYRYTEWVKFDKVNFIPMWNRGLKGAELYDHAVDPMENHNVANQPNFREIRRVLKEQLRQGWRHALPNIYES